MAETNIKPYENDEQSIKQVIVNIKTLFLYLLKKWKIIILFLIMGLGAGALKSIRSTPMYTGRCTFVLDAGSKNSIGGGLAVLGLGGEKGGLFNELENIKWLYSSDMMIKRTLLTAAEDEKGQKKLLINWFIQESGISEKFKKSDALKNVKFEIGVQEDSLSRPQGAAINMCIGLIRENYLKVIDAGSKTEQLLTVLFKSKDEMLSKRFTEEIVKGVNDYYIYTKTQKTKKEVDALQKKADSTIGQLNASMYRTAAAYESIPNANPSHQALQVKPQRGQIDVQMNSVILTEILKNLETRKMDLAQETPLIQIIEKPSIPLDVLSVPLVRTMIVYSILFVVLITVILTVLYYYNKVMSGK